MRFLCLLESYRQVDVELSSGQVVWYGILDIVDVGYPIIAADVRKVKQIENVYANPYAFEMPPEIVGADSVFFSADQLVLEADIKTLVGRCTEIADIAAYLWRCHGEAVGNDAFKAELQLRELREIIVEENAETVTLVSRTRYFHSVQVFLCLHQRETEPGVCSGNELSEKLEVNTGNETVGFVTAGVDNFQIVELVWNDVVKFLVVGFCRDFERTVECAECVVATENQLYAPL